MAVTDQKVFGAVTPQTIQEWKKSGRVNEVTITNEDGTKAVGYYRPPDVAELLMVSRFVQDDPLRASLVLYDACLLGGDVAFRDDLSVKMSAAGEMMKAIKPLAAEVKNL